ncbi:MAG: hypothetical protein ACKO96_36825 [Flammeovirgaceae bacterium]
MIITITLCWFALCYVLVRQIFFSFTFWSVSLFWITLLMISISAGRQVVEQKLVAQLKEQNKADSKALVSLSEEEQS